jgi:putative transposase
MDHRGVGKTEMFRYNTQLRKEFKFVEELNSHACQTAVERVLKAVNRFYDNCKSRFLVKKGIPNSRKILALLNTRYLGGSYQITKSTLRLPTTKA